MSVAPQSSHCSTWHCRDRLKADFSFAGVSDPTPTMSAADLLPHLKQPALIKLDVLGARRAVDVLHDIALAVGFALDRLHIEVVALFHPELRCLWSRRAFSGPCETGGLCCFPSGSQGRFVSKIDENRYR
jgi:hypothetical protein